MPDYTEKMYAEKQYAAAAAQIGGTGSYAVDEGATTFLSPVRSAKAGLVELNARLNQLAARLTGPMPPTAGSTLGGSINKLAGVPNGLFEEIADVGRSMNGNLGEAFEALSRIERSLP